MSKLSAAQCSNAKPDKGDRDRLLGDGDGLFLRIRPNGTKTWVIDYVFNEQRRKFSIGKFDDTGSPGASIPAWLEHARLSLRQARAIAGHCKAERRAGRDAIKEWEETVAVSLASQAAAAKALAAATGMPTVSEAIDRFMKQHMDDKKSAPGIKYRLLRLAQILGAKKINTVTRQDIIKALERIAAGQKVGRTAKQLAGDILNSAKRVWYFAEVREWVEKSPIATLTRKDFDARPVKRNVTLRIEELAELWRCLDDPGRCKSDPVTVAALRLLILTGQREREVTDAEWKEFDFSTNIWTIPSRRTKMGKTHLVHLSSPAVKILQDIRSITGGSRHVFASPRRKGQAIFGRSVNNALLTLYKRGVLPATLTQCHVHDLRRTLITRLPDLGFESFIGHKIAGHTMPGIMGVYNHNEYLSQRQAALEAWANRIHALAGDPKVVQFRRPAAAKQ